jgi:hypothetical protein
MERGFWVGRETVNKKRKLSAVFLQPIQNPSYRLLQEGVGGGHFVEVKNFFFCFASYLISWPSAIPTDLQTSHP